ncbi:DNA-binding HxlR family transcriptional regulator [Amycolatopsis endophytica]|uniref:DNA-binding HxlR family transcriptional regulator n=1 Tax=Amycolatopsis endophytica TaxID=860233 RepID=A0A853AYM4_9PSEU|nr:helix-turn-helix domain-containing protein [Amycolatopsis endophytica]NYI87737.1 DNA-binding HxlR family transcriptional regulator [Amycolatopsis endophytica]
MDTVQSYLRACPARTVLDALANKWTLLVLSALRRSAGPVRFNALRRQLEGITQKSLTQTLRTLERDGLVDRAVYPTVPPRVEYSLTELGAQVGEMFTVLGDWAEEHVGEILSAREAFDNRPAPQPLR